MPLGNRKTFLLLPESEPKDRDEGDRRLLLEIVANAMHVIDGSRRPADGQAKAEFSSNYLSALEFFMGGEGSTLRWIADHIEELDEDAVRCRAFSVGKSNLAAQPIRFAFSRELLAGFLYLSDDQKV